mgnify:CR=1 FL=1
MAVTNEPHIVLLGGGYTLRRVAKLLAPGSFVITSRRPEQRAEWRACGWLSERVDIEKNEGLEDLFRTFPALSVLVDSVPPTRGRHSTLGVENVTRALEESSIKKIVYVSTTGVFGGRDGSVVDEDTVPVPWNEQGQARLDSEKSYRRWSAAAVGRASTALRLPAIYGPDRGLAESLRRGSYRLIGDGSFWTNRIHVDDLAQIVVKAILTDRLPEVLCVSDDCPALAREVVAFVCDQENIGFPPCISEQEARRAGNYTMLSNQRIKNERMKKLLNITLRYPSFREGMGKSALAS